MPRRDRSIFLALPGIWINSNPDTNGIARMVISEADGNLSLQVYAIGPDGLIDWGPADVAVFAATPNSRLSCGFYVPLRLRLRGNATAGNDPARA